MYKKKYDFDHANGNTCTCSANGKNVNLGDSGTKPPCKRLLSAGNPALVKDPSLAPGEMK